MITRFYVDNYKCLVNFEYKPKPMELIVGSNGSGKTTVFEALGCVQDFVLNQKKASEFFSSQSLTRWQSRGKMVFVLELDDEDKKYKYELVLDVDEEGIYSMVSSENLRLNGNHVIKSDLTVEDFDHGKNGISINMYMDVAIYSAGKSRLFRVSDIEKSTLGYHGQGFREALEKMVSVKLQPALISSIVEDSEERPSRSFDNFPAYYFYLLQEKQSLIFDLIPILRENIDGFRSFIMEQRGTRPRKLRVEFAVEGSERGQTVPYDFSELSDGQRALIALYTLAFCESGSTLLIDEPENFISSRELQPWLMLLQERIEDFGGQAILISHHPEFINVLAPQDAIQFRRKDGGPVMIRPFEIGPYQGLTPAEIVARGWENE
ncbi:putative ATPase [Abditibacterium utsteinense]|uniref:Putative ATPase n=1 Tax=Abditibacterium utsteinense TaxID=1960156 RepID=A0A2S8SPM7_9BACT|nr:ATP-binding protein [Abditibacterium utsteinense]PQV62755.1 putative ATPase [Abditibacterium utsteinense]